MIRGEVPEGRLRGTAVAHPVESLNWVVQGETHVLGAGIGDSIDPSVLHLGDEHFRGALRESTTLVGVQEVVLGEYLQTGGGEERFEVIGQVDIDPNFVVLQADQRQGETRVQVKGKQEREVHLGGGTRDARRHLRPVLLRGGVKVNFRVDAPPALVETVDALSTHA